MQQVLAVLLNAHTAGADATWLQHLCMHCKWAWRLHIAEDICSKHLLLIHQLAHCKRMACCLKLWTLYWQF